jgi:hypothetical protein
VSATRTGRRPARTGSRLAASYHTKLVHRVKHATQLSATWLCGSATHLAFPVEDPAEFGGVCARCDAVFFGTRQITRSPQGDGLSSRPVVIGRSDDAGTVYRCYSADGRLLYIGSCRLWPNREAMHRKQTPWWPEVARVDKEQHPNLGMAKQAEIAAIRAEAPLRNKVHNVKRFRREGYAFVPLMVAA